MNILDYQGSIIAGLIGIFFAWRFFKFRKVKLALPKLIETGAIVVDVRSPEEFKQGSRPGSLNIPLKDINARLHELNQKKTIILCCASGSRSGFAAGILKQNGFNNVINAGPWQNTLT